MTVSIPFLIVAVLVAGVLGWLLRGFMQRVHPTELKQLDEYGNAAAAKAADAAQKAKDYADKQMR